MKPSPHDMKARHAWGTNLPASCLQRVRCGACMAFTIVGCQRSSAPTPVADAATPSSTLAAHPQPSSTATAAAQPSAIPEFALKLPTSLPRSVGEARDRCSEGNHASCIQFAKLLLQPSVALDRPALAVQVLRKSCAVGSLAACAELGSLEEQGLGTSYDPAAGSARRTLACDGGADVCGLTSCAIRKTCTEEQLTANCAQGSVEACKALTNSTDAGGALKLFETRVWELCKQGNLEACLALRGSSRFHQALETSCIKLGLCVIVSPPTVARASMARRCSQGEYSLCVPLPNIVGSRLVERACLAGLTRACRLLPKDRSRGVLKMACELGELGACARYTGRDPVFDREESVDMEDDGQRERIQFACDHGSAWHCLKVALELKKSLGTGATVVAALERACPAIRYRVERRDISAKACELAGDAWRRGEGVERDYALAAELYRRGCFPEGTRYGGRSLAACTALAEMSELGQGVPPSPSRATALYAGACYAHDLDACRIVADRIDQGLGIAQNPDLAAKIRSTGGIVKP
jgi:TPR repeat protein